MQTSTGTNFVAFFLVLSFTLRKELVLNYNFHLYTVHDIIDIVSHKLGGIHSSEPTTKEESILKIINELKPDMFMDQKIRPPVLLPFEK